MSVTPDSFAKCIVGQLIKSGWKMTSIDGRGVLESYDARRAADTAFMATIDQECVDEAIWVGRKMAQLAFIEDSITRKIRAHEAALDLAALRDIPYSDQK